VARKEKQVSTPLLKNILAQPASLRAVASYQSGPGFDSLRRAADLLLTSRRVIITGMGASLYASLPLRYLLAANGIPASLIETGELLYFGEAQLDEDIAVILVSRSGESIEMVKLLDILHERRCRTIGVANVPGTTLPENANISILLNSPSDQLVAIQTYTATVVTLALLGAAVLTQFDDARSQLNSALGILDDWLPGCVVASETWNAFAGLPSPLYILGRGPALASVNEGVLLMHETAKAPAVAMSVPQFRHGPVEVTDSRFHAVIIGTQPLTAEMDLQLAGDLERMGGHIRWLGPLPPSSSVKPLCLWPGDVPERFSALFETVPFQLLAYRMAEIRGFVPGDFRWSGAITSAESGFPGLTGS
jgi:glutamine---fructose-6-phosphate transaminase (isomerizing)